MSLRLTALRGQHARTITALLALSAVTSGSLLAIPTVDRHPSERTARPAAADAGGRVLGERASRYSARAKLMADSTSDDKPRPELTDLPDLDPEPKPKPKPKKAAAVEVINEGMPSLRPGTPEGLARIAWTQIRDAAQFKCFEWIVEHESGWNPRADNPSSDAYGLVQALPGSKMASAGVDWRTNPATQIRWGLNYMNGRYGSPCGAQAFWQSHNWY